MRTMTLPKRTMILLVSAGVAVLTAIPSQAVPLPFATVASTLQMTASPTTVVYPQTAHLSGKLLDSDGAGVSDQVVRIEVRRKSSTSWTPATSRTTAADGSFSWDARLAASSDLRAVFDGDAAHLPSTSNTSTVQVRPVIGFTQTYVIGRGQRTRLGGSVAPSTPGRAVVLYYLSGSTWRSSGLSTKVDANGRWGIDVTYSTYGDRTLRAQLAGGTDQLGATSPQRTSRVTYPFTTVVSTGGRNRIQTVKVTAPGGSCTMGLARILAGATKTELHPGSKDPGGSWNTPTSLTPSTRGGAVAAFNSGFVIKSSRGGFRLEGYDAYPLRNGAASLVLVSDGTWRLGTWGRDVSDSARVVAVRQNLELMVDGSKVLPTVDSDIQGRWGATFGAATNTWRSGLGIDPGGNLVYVMGSCLSPRQVAQALVEAGSVRGMQLDVNVYWPAFDYYNASSTTSTSLTPHKLLPDEHNPADHYFTTSERDFFAIRSR